VFWEYLMSNNRNPLDNDINETAIFSDQNFEAETFVDSMESKAENKRRKRIVFQRIDELQESRRLREELGDWDLD
jgi:hypothetical protein